MIVGELEKIPSSESMPCNQTHYMVALTTPLYSASAGEREMELYFLLNQQMGPLPSMKKNLEVDFWSELSPFQ